MTSPARSGAHDASGARAGPLVRVLDVVVGLLSAGLLVVGVLLVPAQFLAPPLLSMAGWGQATGPGWARIGAHLVVGVAGEVVVRFRGRLGRPARAAADLAVVAAAVGTIAWAWWP